MRQELDEQLCKNYPKMMVNRDKPMTETCMCWGFDCGDGWFNIINQLMGNIQNHIDWRAKQGHVVPQVTLDQVKEKFGTLRFYFHLEYDPVNQELAKKYPELQAINKRYADYIDGVVHFADVASGRTCEVTGADGEMHVRGGWFKVLNREVAKIERYQDYTPWSEVKKDAP